MATNIVLLCVGVVIRFVIYKNFFISQPFLTKLLMHIGDNIIHNKIVP